ncbi:MAG TPA: hypothetical protein VEW03_02930 [Longimicrobiaceae bacterium]|nr:hypothetical protein [Longimicrobiaceae bacterium]
MKRCALALLGLLALPAAAAAQDRPLLANEPPPERLPDHRWAVTPYLGVRVPFNTGNQVIFLENGDQFRFSSERGGSGMIGLNVERQLRGPVSLVVGGAYSGREQDVLTVVALDSSVTQFELDGPAMWFAKAGVTVRLPDPIPDNRRFHPSAFVTVAPTLMWLDWASVDGAPDDFNRSSHHLGLNLGIDAVTRLGTTSGWALSLGLEDFITFWDTDALLVRDRVVGETVTGEPVSIDYDYSSSNIIALRLGVSYRFR